MKKAESREGREESREGLSVEGLGLRGPGAARWAGLLLLAGLAEVEDVAVAAAGSLP